MAAAKQFIISFGDESDNEPLIDMHGDDSNDATEEAEQDLTCYEKMEGEQEERPPEKKQVDDPLRKPRKKRSSRGKLVVFNRREFERVMNMPFPLQ